jgi:NAD(P)-dependent dehydrogenase (short-subunit alcohol dehydrogenase family)
MVREQTSAGQVAFVSGSAWGIGAAIVFELAYKLAFHLFLFSN